MTPNPAYPSFRSVSRLSAASPLSGRPDCIPLPKRLAAAPAAGLRFEASVAAALPKALHGQWFAFTDADGDGFCQPDLIYPFLPDYFAVIEVKYTLVPGAFAKLSSLYLPVVSKALSEQTAGVVIVKNLDPRYRRGRIFTDLRSAADAAFDTGRPSLLQWSGQSLIRSPGGVRLRSNVYNPSVQLS